MGIPISPNTGLHSLGRGVLSIAEWSGGSLGSYVDVGNCNNFDVEVTEKVLNHYSTRSGVRIKNRSVVLETGYNVSFVLGEVSIKNLKMFLHASGSSRVLMASQLTDQEYGLKFVSDNPIGPNETWELWRVRFSPGSAFNLISDEWSKLTFKGEGLDDAAQHPTSPLFTVSFATTTSTTTSTSTTTTTTTT